MASATAGTAGRERAQRTTGSPRVSWQDLCQLATQVTTVPGEHEEMEVENSATGDPLPPVPRCEAEDVELAVSRARAAQERWRESPWPQRRDLLLRFHDLVLDCQDELLDVLQMEAGKARRHAFEEIMDVAMVCRHYARAGWDYLKPTRRQGAFPLLTQAWEYHHPVGVVGIVAPWNYPLTLSISDALPAIAAGNAVVIKVDSQTPFSTLLGRRLLAEAGLPTDVMQVITGSGADLGPELIDRVDYVMFTGSTEVGRKVASQASERLIPSSMELGGKNAMIVLDDANLTRAAEGAERAMFSNAGQLCVAMERLLVHENVAEEFTRRLVKRIESMRLGSGLSYDYDMGSLMSQDQLDTVREHLDDALSKGARVLAGGQARPDLGPYFHEPTLLSGVTEEMELFSEETFGPVIALYTFASEQEAIERANASNYGLNFSVWTGDSRRGRQLATRLQAGTVNINEGYIAAWGSVEAPMGGMKDSGLGRRHGATGILKYTEAQTIAVQRLVSLGPPRWLGQRLWTRVITAGLRLLRALPGVK